jgi:ubiquitin-protein ligase
VSLGIRLLLPGGQILTCEVPPFKDTKVQTERQSMSGLGSIIAPQAAKRVLKDIQRAKEPLMQEQGIWYCMLDDNMTRGQALILGPEGSPYAGCLLLFSIEFPTDYPFSPPKVLFLTSDGRTRFHPNLYVEGKVCLSILGTFSGPGWSGTQSLSSVLMSILGLLDTNPLSHEPAYERGTLQEARHRDYADFVEYNMVALMMQEIKRFEAKDRVHPWKHFEEEVIAILPRVKQTLAKKILEKASAGEKLWSSVMYSMHGRSFWNSFKEVPWVLQVNAAA